MDEIFRNDESINFTSSTFSSMVNENTQPLNLTFSEQNVEKTSTTNSEREQFPLTSSSETTSSSTTSKMGKIKSSYYQQKKALMDIGLERNDILKDHVISQSNSQTLYKEGVTTLKQMIDVLKERNELLKSLLDKSGK